MSLDDLIPHAQVSVVSGGSQHHQYPVLLLLVTLLANTRQTFQIDKLLLQSLPRDIVPFNTLLFIFVAFPIPKSFEVYQAHNTKLNQDPSLQDVES